MVLSRITPASNMLACGGRRKDACRQAESTQVQSASARGTEARPIFRAFAMADAPTTARARRLWNALQVWDSAKNKATVSPPHGGRPLRNPAYKADKASQLQSRARRLAHRECSTQIGWA